MKVYTLIILLMVANPFFSSANDVDELKKGFAPLAIEGTQYTTAVGIRTLGTSGLTIKHHMRTGYEIEGIVGFYPDALSFTVLFEKSAPAFDVAGLNWYYGLGGHVAGESNFVNNSREGRFQNTDATVGFGFDGIFGLEYKIDQTPIAISFGMKPFIEVNTNGSAFVAADPGLGIKVTF